MSTMHKSVPADYPDEKERDESYRAIATRKALTAAFWRYRNRTVSTALGLAIFGCIGFAGLYGWHVMTAPVLVFERVFDGEQYEMVALELSKIDQSKSDPSFVARVFIRDSVKRAMRSFDSNLAQVRDASMRVHEKLWPHYAAAIKNGILPPVDGSVAVSVVGGIEGIRADVLTGTRPEDVVVDLEWVQQESLFGDDKTRNVAKKARLILTCKPVTAEQVRLNRNTDCWWINPVSLETVPRSELPGASASEPPGQPASMHTNQSPNG